jgi:tRNA1(Val) A37 N6-methylase TrmN6
MQRLLAIYRPSICPFEPIVRLVPSSANVLDFGCGSGALVLLLAAIGRIKKGIACEISTPGQESHLMAKARSLSQLQNAISAYL